MPYDGKTLQFTICSVQAFTATQTSDYEMDCIFTHTYVHPLVLIVGATRSNFQHISQSFVIGIMVIKSTTHLSNICTVNFATVENNNKNHNN